MPGMPGMPGMMPQQMQFPGILIRLIQSFNIMQLYQRHWFNNKQVVLILKITFSALKIFLFSSKLSETKIKTHILKLSHIWEILKLFLSTLAFQLFLFLILTFGFIWRTSRRINAASATSLPFCCQHRRWAFYNILFWDFPWTDQVLFPGENMKAFGWNNSNKWNSGSNNGPNNWNVGNGWTGAPNPSSNPSWRWGIVCLFRSIFYL